MSQSAISIPAFASSTPSSARSIFWTRWAMRRGSSPITAGASAASTSRARRRPRRLNTDEISPMPVMPASVSTNTMACSDTAARPSAVREALPYAGRRGPHTTTVRTAVILIARASRGRDASRSGRAGGRAGRLPIGRRGPRHTPSWGAASPGSSSSSSAGSGSIASGYFTGTFWATHSFQSLHA